MGNVSPVSGLDSGVKQREGGAGPKNGSAVQIPNAGEKRKEAQAFVSCGTGGTNHSYLGGRGSEPDKKNTQGKRKLTGSPGMVDATKWPQVRGGQLNALIWRDQGLG